MSSHTCDYPYCEFPFERWNKVQEKCLPNFTQKKNIVLASTVASGKTAVAEAVMGYELHSSESSIAVYASPLKALSMEKYENWLRHPTFSRFHIELLDSDHHPETFDGVRIILSTIESLDISCRSKASWLKNVSVLIFDEAHLIGSEDRGAVSEGMLMSFSRIVPDARLILLSGTMSNASELAAWVRDLNGLETSFLSSSWRPTVLEKNVEVRKSLRSQFEFICEKIKDNPYDKILIFVHSKKIGKLLQDEIRRSGSRCSFFSADLNEDDRIALLNKFKDPNSGLDVLVATSSLAMGVSL